MRDGEALARQVRAQPCADQAEGLRRAMIARVAALAARRPLSSAASVRPWRVAVLASDAALSHVLAQQLMQAASSVLQLAGVGGPRRALQCRSFCAEPSGQLPASLQTADQVLLVLDASERGLPASMTWADAWLRHWQAGGRGREPALARGSAAKVRLVVHAASDLPQAQRAIQWLQASARELGLQLPVAACWQASHAPPQVLARLAVDLLQTAAPAQTQP